MGAPDDPLQLCVIGRDPFGPRLDEAASRQHIDQHPILVRHLENTEGAEQCHIAFVGGSAKQSAEAMLTALQGQPILTVTDDRLGPQRGRSEEHTSELQSLMRISYAVFCLKKKNTPRINMK